MANMPMSKDNPLKGKKTGKWTKYGGAVHGMVKETIQDHWYCQICGQEMPKELKPFLHELLPGDFIRICNSCMYEVNKNKPKTTIIYRKKVTIIRSSK